MKCIFAWSAAALLAAFLMACGGGGNESGPADQILASPSSVTVTGDPGQCASGLGPTVFIYGGTPPYKITNSAPTGITLDRNVVPRSGEGVRLYFTKGVCLDQIPITIEDDMGRVLPVPVTNAKGAEG
jgi:hypothetical protein